MSAVGSDIITRIVGYALEPGNFAESSPNLPIRIAVLAEANTDMQAGLDVNTPLTITSSAKAAEYAGYGSPLHQIAKILFPLSGSGIGGIPVIWYPQAEAGGSTAKIMQIAATGTATGNGTHFVKLSGRTSVEGVVYAVNIVKDDDAETIHGKIADAINAALAAPCTATDDAYYAELTSKWKGLTAEDITVSMETNDNDLGITYAITDNVQAGSGTPSVAASLQLFENNWNTHVINSYGTVTTVMDALEAYNGKPDPVNPTGRYSPTIFKPFMAYTGSVAEDPSSITSTRLNECTIKISPAPLSKGLPMEAAANDVLLAALVAQNSPHLDVIGQAYPDMPTPDSIGDMASYIERNRIVKAGCSTVDLVGGRYVIQDPVTTYHPLSEVVPQYRYARILVIDWNVRYTYLLNEQVNVLDKVIAGDNDVVTATNVIKPKIWKAILADMAEELVLRGLLVDAPFTVASITCGISTTNPDKLATTFRYKRSGVVRISDTVATAGFNFGTLTANQ
jgi:phage tail sheath gpL-like